MDLLSVATYLGLCVLAVFLVILCIRCILNWELKKINTKNPIKSSINDGVQGSISILEIQVKLPCGLIFSNESCPLKFNMAELVNSLGVPLGEGNLGPLYKLVLGCGSTVTIRRLREYLAKLPEINQQIAFIGGIRDALLSPILFSFWYGDDTFIVYEYFCMGSLEELLHGKEGISFTPLSWEMRSAIAFQASSAMAMIHNQVDHDKQALVLGVLKPSNIMVRPDFSTCLASLDASYLTPPITIIRRNLGRAAPELRRSRESPILSCKSDVYSFGVLLLELVTGKKPVFDNGHGKEITLVGFVRAKTQKEGVNTAFDERICDGVEDGMTEMMNIAKLCLMLNPDERPTMVKVVEMILQLNVNSNFLGVP
ncbi:probable inactive receptor kinase At4g23740 [Amborella trichopoda]|uniref:Protein kinase domain-containing protein n=1 Tax=Amborella trichopoda TaxID=13333 RepID=U5CWI9_AMBTC|nr:probable inactive receptor kinase At4g23740 [Amborella trichopoda]ERN17701.1 hypothetical protein AMTR_s00059p00211320 [Amborella trichopoda]|eukprot:XP_020530312.1 probable inactive receptor kinase At4g23740 [Amborella trichopoda]